MQKTENYYIIYFNNTIKDEHQPVLNRITLRFERGGQ